MTKTIIGIFDDRANVESAINELRDEGLDPKDVSIVMKDQAQAKEIGTSTGADVAGGAVSGATTGALIGGLAGLLAATILPGVGAFLIGGPIAASLGLTGAAATTVSGAATGLVAGGLIGALMGLGLSKDEAEQYQTRIEAGAILIAVPATDNDEDIVIEIFDEYGASDVRTLNQPREQMQSTGMRHHFADADIDDAIDEGIAEEPSMHTHAHVAGAKGGTARRSETIKRRTRRTRV